MRSYTCTYPLSNTQVLAYAKWLNKFDWEYYCTLTTAYSLSLKAARRALNRLYGFLTKNHPEVKIFWVAEPFDLKYGYHLHALVSFNNPIFLDMKAMLKKAWQVVTKGNGGKEYNNTHIAPYDKNLGANYYVAKYLTRRDVDYDFFL